MDRSSAPPWCLSQLRCTGSRVGDTLYLDGPWACARQTAGCDKWATNSMNQGCILYTSEHVPQPSGHHCVVMSNLLWAIPFLPTGFVSVKHYVTK